MSMLESNSINAFMKNGVEEFIFLFLPEDTTENGCCIDIGGNKTRNTVKVVFWIAISLAVSLAVGLLK